MENKAFEQWCRKATKEIRYPPDREQVYKELMGHLEDHRDACMAEGLTEETATEKALAAMGKAGEIAPALGRLHRPFWGYLYTTVKVLAIALCIFALLLTLLPMFTTIPYFVGVNSETYQLTASEMDTYYLADQSASDFSDGFLFRIPKSLFWRCDDTLNLKFHLQVLNCSFSSKNTSFVDHFWAVDSNGNYYESRSSGMYTDLPRLISNQCHSVGYLDIHTMTVLGIPSADIQWVELHYDRDGRDVVLRIDLTGGVGT